MWGSMDKIKRLREKIRGYNSAIIAFSGGVDSTFLLMHAVEELGEKVLAVTLDTPLIPRQELQFAKDTAIQLGAKQIVIAANPLDIPDVKDNFPERCYHCKKYLLGFLCQYAEEKGYQAVLDGANSDDLGDFRPGIRAAQELGVVSPLLEIGITKEEVRQFLRGKGLPFWDKPSAACLASRIPYGDEITDDKLGMIEDAEVYLKSLLKGQVRVRLHRGLARIEVEPPIFPDILQFNQQITTKLKKLGFSYVALDLLGYREGSFDELL